MKSLGAAPFRKVREACVHVQELREHNIRVTTIFPAYVSSDMTRCLPFHLSDPPILPRRSAITLTQKYRSFSCKATAQNMSGGHRKLSITRHLADLCTS